MGAILVYDLTKQDTFDNIPRWIRELSEHARSKVHVQYLLVSFSFPSSYRSHTTSQTT